MPDYTPYLDRRQELAAGTHSAGTTTWNLPYYDPDGNVLIIGSGASQGEVRTDITVQNATYPYTVSVTGNYDGIQAVFGVAMAFSVTLTNPFRLRTDGTPDFTSRLTVRHLDVSYYKSGSFGVSRTMANRSGATVTFAGNSDGSVTATDTLRVNLNGNTHDATWIVSSSNPKRVVIPSVEFFVDVNNRKDG